MVVTLSGLGLTLPACGDRRPTDAEVVGTYRAGPPADSAAGRRVQLDLAVGNAARMSTDFQDGDAPILETGTWTVGPDGSIRVVLARNGFGPVTTDVRFRLTAPVLAAVAYDTARWGPGGLSLRRD
jgi:hypothetical protein